MEVFFPPYCAEQDKTEEDNRTEQETHTQKESFHLCCNELIIYAQEIFHGHYCSIDYISSIQCDYFL